jgi:hypothetical protein
VKVKADSEAKRAMLKTEARAEAARLEKAMNPADAGVARSAP